MTFITVPEGYEKTSLSDLQGAWGCLRDAVVDNGDFVNANKIIFHIDEAMSWESVRNLEQMKATLLIVHNLATQAKAPEEIQELISEVTMNNGDYIIIPAHRKHKVIWTEPDIETIWLAVLY